MRKRVPPRAPAPTPQGDRFVDAHGLSAVLDGTSTRSIEKWREDGTGPPFYRVGRRCLYRLSEVELWLSGRRRVSTGGGDTRKGQINDRLAHYARLSDAERHAAILGLMGGDPNRSPESWLAQLDDRERRDDAAD